MFDSDRLTVWTLHVMAVAFTAALVYQFIMGGLSAEAFLGVAGSVIGYFTAAKKTNV